MRLAMLLACGSLTVLLHSATAHAQAAAETALTTAVTSATAGTAAPKIAGSIRVASISSRAASSGGTVHRYTRHTHAVKAAHQVSGKITGKADRAANAQPHHVTYRRIQ